MPIPDQQELTHFIERFFHIDDVTAGSTGENYLLRYRGKMMTDQVPAAYDELAAFTRSFRVTPLFRVETDGRHVILFVEGVIEPKPSRVSTNVIMLILTIISVMLAGVQIPKGVAIPTDTLGQITLIVTYFFTGWPFALALLSILGAHELGHYFAGRYHKTHVTLPYFIPLPFSLLGTMGAFIQMKEIPKNKRHLLDIGIAGPLAGLIVAIPVLLIGLKLSELGPIQPVDGGFIEGNSLFYLFAKFVVFGKLLPSPADYGNIPPLLYWLRYFFTGSPVPYGGTDVFIHPVALAGWAGLLVTSLNLIPAGQLDGGHIMYVLFGKRLRYAFPVIIAILMVLGWFWPGWWLWVFLLLIFGRVYDEPLDQITELDPLRRALAIAAIVIFFLVLAPVPMISL